MKQKRFSLDNDKELELIGDALSSRTRRKILHMLSITSYTTADIIKELNLSKSTVSFHLKVLEDAQLIKKISAPNKKGEEKSIFLALNKFILDFVTDEIDGNNTVFIDIPVGSYSTYNITPPCALLSKERVIGMTDDPIIFESTKKTEAQLLSFYKGFVEYTILINKYKDTNIQDLTFSMELCSECPYYNNNWKSDITFWINGIEVATFRSLGDYGGRRGKFTPSWWVNSNTQYGVMILLKITSNGIYLDNKKISDLTMQDLNILHKDTLLFRIGVKDNAHYVGGVNLFGKDFGDYAQDIRLTIHYID